MKGRKVERCSRIKDGNWRLAWGEDKMRRIWKEYFEDLDTGTGCSSRVWI